MEVKLTCLVVVFLLYHSSGRLSSAVDLLPRARSNEPVSLREGWHQLALDGSSSNHDSLTVGAPVHQSRLLGDVAIPSFLYFLNSPTLLCTSSLHKYFLLFSALGDGQLNVFSLRNYTAHIRNELYSVWMFPALIRFINGIMMESISLP